jgi:hypothetical protein
MSPLVVGAALAATALGLAAVRSASRPARAVALGVSFVFALAALDLLVATLAGASPRLAAAILGRGPDAGAVVRRLGTEGTGDAFPPPRVFATAEAAASAVGTAMLAAAGHAGPRAMDLAIVWAGPFAEVASDGPLGAQTATPAAGLPFPPEALQVRAATAPSQGRPCLLQLGAEGLGEPVDVELRLEHAGGEVLRERVVLRPGVGAEIAWTPAAAGLHAIEIETAIRGHLLGRRGAITVGESPRVLALEPRGIAAAALRAQGVDVVEASVLPDELQGIAAVVVGRPLDADAQTRLAAAVGDGTGVFVLAPGFGSPGEPIRALLPLQPAPPSTTEPGTGAGGEAAGEPPTKPPEQRHDAPPDEPPAEQPPAGETAGAAPVSNEPIEVDKRAIAMVLVVDRSGSMGTVVAGGQSKMSYAKTSALATARALAEGDEVAIVTYGNKGQGRVELPLTPAVDVGTVRQGIERLAHGPELTFLLSGLQRADELLQKSQAAVKHVVVITDGEFDTRESVALRKLAYEMRTQRHATVSIVSIVDDSTAPEYRSEAELLTLDGGGTFLPARDVDTVPVFVSAEVTRALRRADREPKQAGDGPPDQPLAKQPEPAVEPPERDPPPPEPPAAEPKTAPGDRRVAVRAVAESALLEPKPAGAWPMLGSAIRGEAPIDAHVLLAAGEEGHPLLAFGNRGLGRVGAFAADLAGPDGAEFRADPAFAARLAQWVQAVLPAVDVRAPAALLTATEMPVPAPLPRELADLARWGGSPVAALADVRRPVEPALRTTWRGCAATLAAFALLALLALAAAERWSAARPG